MRLAALYLRALRLLGADRRVVALLVGANLLVTAAQFAEPVLYGRIIDVLSRDAPQAGAAIAGLIGLWILFAVGGIAAGVLLALLADRLTHRRRLAVLAETYEHTLELPLAFHRRAHSGRLVKVLLEGANGLAGIWLTFLRDQAAAVLTLLALIPVSLILNWRLGALLVGLVALFAALTSWVLRRTEALQHAVEGHHSELAERATDTIGNLAIVQSFARIDAEVRAIRDLIERLLAAQMPVLSWWAVAAVASRASATLTTLGVFVLGIWLVRRGEASLGEVVTFSALAGVVIARLEQVIGFANHAVLQAPKLAELFALADTVPEVADRPGARAMGRLAGQVRFDHVGFLYSGDRPALVDVSFEARPGETVALVGETGSGKSTTLALLYRAYDPTSGAVTIDGVDLREMTLQSLRRNVGVVFQEPMLFARTIGDNLRVGRPQASEAELEDACRRAQVLDVVRRLPEGFATRLGERGATLSGGERQRLAIARAILKDPPILILDEATSALDAATEARLQSALEEVMRGRTTFVIAHRLATIKDADQILVLEAGRIVERGSFASLAAARGRFARLVEAQTLGSQPTLP